MPGNRLTLTETDPLSIPAHALVVETNGWLTASRGLAEVVSYHSRYLKTLLPCISSVVP